MEYKYVGDGAGVPGLPHEISDEEAKALGVTKLLQAACENGSYIAVSGTVSTETPLKSKDKKKE